MTEDIPLSKLRLLKHNPRRITKEQLDKLCKSLQDDPEFLTKRPVLVNNIDGKYHVYAGNQRVSAARKLGWKTIPCIVEENLTEDLIKARVIKDNKGYGEFDFDMLANEWDVSDLLEWGFTESELAIDVDQIEGDPVDEDDQQLEPKKDPVTKLGDIYELRSESNRGENVLCHRIICGDSTDPDVVSRLLEDREPVLMVTDPPYGVEYDPEWRKEHNKNTGAYGKVENDDKVNWALAWHLFPGSVAYVWHASTHTSEVHKSLIDSDYQIVNNIIWNKQHFAMSRGDYHWKHETCWYAVKKGHPHNWQGSRKECTVWDIANLNFIGKSKDEDDRTEHSTQKPIECMSKPIRNNSAPYEEVYDPFLGSGTTLIACEQYSRVCYGVELSPNYCDVIVNRWDKYMTKNQKPFSIKKNGEAIEWAHQVYL